MPRESMTTLCKTGGVVGEVMHIKEVFERHIDGKVFLYRLDKSEKKSLVTSREDQCRDSYEVKS